MEARRIYLLLGIVGTGRRDLLWRVAGTELDRDEKLGVLWPAGEWDRVEGMDVPPKLALSRWTIEGGKLRAQWPLGEENGVVFWVAPGSGNPADFIETVPAVLAAFGARIGQIVTLVDCGWFSTEPRLAPWYDCCIHFSDTVLLGRREGVGDRWVREYEASFRKKCLPCEVDLVQKDGRPRNPGILFSETPRRLSLFFDEIEPDPEDEEMPEAPVDPYLERDPSGQRRIRIPEIERIRRDHPGRDENGGGDGSP